MADRIIFVCILLLAGVYFWATAQIPTLEIGDPLGPKAFPRLLGIGLLLCAAMLLGEMIRDRKVVKEPTPKEELNSERAAAKIVAGATVFTAIFFVSFETAGYILSVTTYLLIMFCYFNRKRWTTNILTAAIYGIGSYLIFTKALGVTLPHGLLPF